jgi:hypothetical protein
MNLEEALLALLPARTRRELENDAAASCASPLPIVVKIVSDHYDAFGRTGSEQQPERSGRRAPPQPESNVPFQVAAAFPKYPPQSLKLAQAFVDEAVSLPGVEVRQRFRSIIFIPRFVRIDYVLSNRAPMPGFVVSFYGTVDQFDDPHRLLKSGPKSYVRARITSDDELDCCRGFLARAFENRLGNKA